MKAQIDSIKQAALAAVEEADGTQALGEVRVRFLGKSGEMTSLMKGLSALSKEERPEMGKLLNEARTEIEAALELKLAAARESEKAARLQAEAVDVTLPGRAPRTGTLHPITQVREDIVKVFLGMGFEVAEGPEIESDLYNFQLLNVPKDHPARDMQDTFYVNDSYVLRTHTSPMQARMMTTKKPPIRVVIPGRVYRSDDDASHSPIFHQIEGLAVDRYITMGDLEGCGAFRRSGRDLRHLRRQGLQSVQRHGLGGDPRSRHSEPRRARNVRDRQQTVQRFRIRARARAHRDDQIRHPQHQALL